MENIRDTGVCIAHTEKVKSLGDLNDYIAVLQKLGSLKPRPQVVVCFCEGERKIRIQLKFCFFFKAKV